MTFNDDIFKSFPALETNNLMLREITKDDAESIFNIRSDPRAMKYFGKEPYTRLDEAFEMINITVEGFREKNGVRWGICVKNSNMLIGTGGFWRIVKDHLRAEIGYDLLAEHWRKGIMYEALTAMINYGFNVMNLHTIEANVDPENTGSIKLLEKLGFHKEGHLKESFYFKGKFTDTGIYSLCSGRFERR